MKSFLKEFIIKVIIFNIMALFGGLVNSFLLDRGIDISYAIYFTVGYFSCVIWNWRWNNAQR